jgi:hypothetical protein
MMVSITFLFEIWTLSAQPPDSTECCCVMRNLRKLDVGGRSLADMQGECLGLKMMVYRLFKALTGHLLLPLGHC